MSLENYIKNKHALCYVFPDKNKKDNEADNKEAQRINSIQDVKSLMADIDKRVEKRERLWLSSPFDIEAYFCDEHDRNYGLLLSWETIKTKQKHKWYMPAGLLAGDGKEILNKFLSEGIEINYSKKAKEKLLSYISMVSPSQKFILVERVGWYKQNFVLPNRTIPSNNELILRSNNELDRQFETSGTLGEWQNTITKYAKNNSRLILALSCAFAAPLLKLTNEESGAIHLVGNSSLGKTTALQVAASVWGSNSFVKQWRVTCNALEVVAQNHNDCLLPLDELAQADSKQASDMIYMLANNQGKRRLKSDITLKGVHNWGTLIFSTGEIDIATKVQEANKRSFAGMEVRFVSIPANCSGGFGIFEDLHGFKTGDAFSKYLKDACSKYYGAAIQKYLECLTNDIDSVTKQIKQIQQEFKTKYLLENASGQVARVANRFGLIAAAGELSIKFGILSSFSQGDVIEAIGRCFKAWVYERGNTQDLELKTSITQVKAFLEKYGESRFVNISETSLVKPIDRAGYKQKIDGVFHYYILPEVYKNEVCKGLNYKQVTKYLLEKGFLIADGQGRSVEVKHLPDIGKIRVYHLTGEILA